MKTISLDLRARILAAYDADEGTRAEVAGRFKVSLGLVKKLLQQRRHTGEIGPRHYRSGRKARLRPQHGERLRQLVAARPDRTLEELRATLGLACTPQALHYVLRDLGLTYKKNAPGGGARPAGPRPGPPALAPAAGRPRPGAAGLPRRSGGQDKHDPARGRAPRGRRLRAQCPHGHWRTTTMISSIRLDGTTACLVIEAATDTEVFYAYVREVLCPTLQPGHAVTSPRTRTPAPSP